MPGFDRFDTRHYPMLDAREGYSAWAATYEDTVEDEMDLALLARVEQVDWRAARRVADLGCGSGRTGAWVHGQGAASIDGIDLTREMLELAHTRGIYASLAVGEVAASGLSDATYDVVTCCLVDEHLDRLGSLYTEAARLLAPGGSFVLVGFHPSFIMRTGMSAHFEHPERGTVGVETHVHLFADHHRAARAAGFVLAELHERVVDDAWVAVKPKWDRYRGWPTSFCCVWQPSR